MFGVNVACARCIGLSERCHPIFALFTFNEHIVSVEIFIFIFFAADFQLLPVETPLMSSNVRLVGTGSDVLFCGRVNLLIPRIKRQV